MRGHIVKRYKSSWSIVLDLSRDPATGNRRQQWVAVKGTKKDAERKLSELLHQVDTGGFMKPHKMTVGEFLRRWLRDYAQDQVRPRTMEGYQERARHLIEALGNISLSELRPDHLQGYYASKLSGQRRDGKGGGLSPGTLIKRHNLIREALAHAVKWGFLGRNVAEAVDPPRPSRQEMRALTAEEAHHLLESCPRTPWYPIFHTLIWTGLRRSELLGLRWRDVDLDLATLRVVQVLHQLRDGPFLIQEPKTAKGRRAVSLSPASCLLLRAHREHQEADAEFLGVPIRGDTLVFGHIDGTPRPPCTLTSTFKKFARRVGLEDVRLHDLRHTHASLLLQQGVHPKVVSERLGHASI
ncbi:tyrosine-type recombinase/integrase [Chloroflexota bacterium]